MTGIHITFVGRAGGLIFDDVEVSFRSDLSLPQITVLRLDPNGARDREHSLTRNLYLTLVGVQFRHLDISPNGDISATGYAIMEEVLRYPGGEGPKYESSDGPCSRCDEEHPVSLAWLPPAATSIPTGVRVEFQIGHETGDAATAAADRARQVALAHIARGHDPECTQDDDPCERCAKVHAGQTVLTALDGDRP